MVEPVNKIWNHEAIEISAVYVSYLKYGNNLTGLKDLEQQFIYLLLRGFKGRRVFIKLPEMKIFCCIGDQIKIALWLNY